MSKLKRFFLCFSITIFLVIVTASNLTVFAHSGRTDSSGGHTNKSTGEYHWHHGYSAHQHTDKDGDGYPEYCPYRDKNKTETTSDSGIDNSQKDKPIWKDIISYGVLLLFFLPIILALGAYCWALITSFIKIIKEKK